MFRGIQIITITNFVVVSSVGIKRVDTTSHYTGGKVHDLMYMADN